MLLSQRCSVLNHVTFFRRNSVDEIDISGKKMDKIRFKIQQGG